MLNAVVEKFLKSRLGFPITLVIAAALLIVSETSYTSATGSLERAVRIGQRRLAMQRLMQSVTDAETGERGYLLTGREELLEPYRAGVANVEATLPGFAASFESEPKEQSEAAAEFAHTIELKLSELATTVEVFRDGRAEAARELVASGIGAEHMERLRQLAATLFDLEMAAGRTQREAIYRALMLSRLGVGLLTALGVLGIFLYMRQSALLDRVRDDQQRRLSEERDRLEREAAQRTQDLRELAAHLQTAREDERGSLARELHDELGALLTAAKLDLARLRNKLVSQPDVRERLDHLAVSLNDGIALKRRIIEDLRPSSLTHLGLVPALEILCRDMSDRLGLPVEMALDSISLPPPADLAVYRFVQEALTNVGKYARANVVHVSMRSAGDGLLIEVEDDGVGFDVSASSAGHHGHTGQRFRVESLGGRMSVSSSPGKGTTLRADLPMRPHPVRAMEDGRAIA